MQCTTTIQLFPIKKPVLWVSGWGCVCHVWDHYRKSMQPLLLLSQVCQHQNRIFFFNHIHQFLIQYQYSLIGQSFERSKNWAILALCYFSIYFVIPYNEWKGLLNSFQWEGLPSNSILVWKGWYYLSKGQVNFRMNFWCLRFFQNATKKL